MQCAGVRSAASADGDAPEEPTGWLRPTPAFGDENGGHAEIDMRLGLVHKLVMLGSARIEILRAIDVAFLIQL